MLGFWNLQRDLINYSKDSTDMEQTEFSIKKRWLRHTKQQSKRIKPHSIQSENTATVQSDNTSMPTAVQTTSSKIETSVVASVTPAASIQSEAQHNSSQIETQATSSQSHDTNNNNNSTEQDYYFVLQPEHFPPDQSTPTYSLVPTHSTVTDQTQTLTYTNLNQFSPALVTYTNASPILYTTPRPSQEVTTGAATEVVAEETVDLEEIDRYASTKAGINLKYALPTIILVTLTQIERTWKSDE